MKDEKSMKPARGPRSQNRNQAWWLRVLFETLDYRVLLSGDVFLEGVMNSEPLISQRLRA